MTPPLCRDCGTELAPDLAENNRGLHLGCTPPEGPDSTVAEMRDVFITHDANSPRSLQTAIGPSEIGVSCDRALAHRVAGTPRRDDVRVPWAPILGTAIHAYVADMLRAENTRMSRQRWVVEERVWMTEEISGSCDAYDDDNNMVIDWKGLSLDTVLPTPTGWSTIRAIQPGDQVIAGDGRPCTVIRKSPVFSRPCLRITFEDNATIVADHVHEWSVNIGQRLGLTLLSTEEARRQLRARDKKAQRHLRVPNAGPLSLPAADSLIPPPYVLGAWLGDGTAHGGAIGKPDDELFDLIAAEGYKISPTHKNSMTRTVYGLSTQLQKLGLIGQKAIPPEYLRGSKSQRLALLQGLMDTDGHWNKIRNQAVFTSTNKALADAVAELAHTLGWKARVFELTKRGYGLVVTAYDVVFTPHDMNPFRLSRKANLVRLAGSARSRRRVIRSVEPTISVPTQCIEVDSADHTYLCGEQMIPTHNCVGENSSQKYKRRMRPEYETQAHLYGLGHANAGRPVQWVRLVFLHRSHDYDKSWEWTQRYDPGKAHAALSRLAAITNLLGALNVVDHPHLWGVVPSQPTPDCSWCPYFRPGPPDHTGCPGDESANARRLARTTQGIIETKEKANA